MQAKFIRFRKQYALKQRRHVRRLKILSKHPVVVPVATFLVLLVLGTAGYFWSTHSTHHRTPAIVVITDNGQARTVPSIEPTVGALMQHLNIHLRTGDVVEPAPATHINQQDFRINIYRATPVEIIDGSNVTYTFSAASTPRSVVQQSGIPAYAEDSISQQPVTNFVTTTAIARQVVINRATPVNVNIFGTPTVLRTHAKTVGALLSERHVTLGNGDSVQPVASTPLTAGSQVFVIHQGTQIVTATEAIPAPVQIINDPTLSHGSTAIRQQGSAGSQIVTYQVNLVNGKEASRTVIQTVVTQQPVTQIVVHGSAPISGSLGTWLLALRTCESGGNYQDNTGNGYYGAYQFSLATWQRLGYSGLPSSADPATQDAAIVANTNKSSGGLATQNPGCYAKEGLSAFPPPS